MEITSILLRQLLTMAIYMAVGFLLFKTGLLTAVGTQELGRLLLFIVIPAAIINSYLSEATVERTSGLLLSLFLSAGALLLAMAVSSLLYRGNGIARFSAAFSNAGFMGIPIVSAVLGADAVFYISSFVALLNISQWTFGVTVMTGKADSIRLKKLITNPIILSMLIGLLVYFTALPVPNVIRKPISAVAGMNAPLAMMVMGGYLAETNLRGMVTCGRNWGVSAARLLLIPTLTAVGLAVLPVDPLVKTAVLIAACAPVGSNVAIFAQMYGKDYNSAVGQTCLSTVFSILTMPIIITAFSAAVT